MSSIIKHHIVDKSTFGKHCADVFLARYILKLLRRHHNFSRHHRTVNFAVILNGPR